jgi:hypothetical protein
MDQQRNLVLNRSNLARSFAEKISGFQSVDKSIRFLTLKRGLTASEQIECCPFGGFSDGSTRGQSGQDSQM